MVDAEVLVDAKLDRDRLGVAVEIIEGALAGLVGRSALAIDVHPLALIQPIRLWLRFGAARREDQEQQRECLARHRRSITVTRTPLGANGPPVRDLRPPFGSRPRLWAS
jgi:hypothetical protein